MTCPVCKENPNAACPLCRCDAYDMAVKGVTVLTLDAHYEDGTTVTLTREDDFLLCVIKEGSAVLTGSAATADLMHTAAAAVVAVSRETGVPIPFILMDLARVLAGAKEDYDEK